MTLAELLAEVYALTNRPDLSAESTSAIKAALLKMHHVDFFYKDLQAALVSLPGTDFVASFETSLLPRFRAMKFIRKWYATSLNTQVWPAANGMAGPFLTLKEPSDILSSYGRELLDIYYVAGTSVNIRTSDAPPKLLVSWYQNPNATLAGLNAGTDWVCIEHPFAIVFDAASSVFKMIGYDEQSARFSQLVSEQIALLRISNIEVEAR